MTRRTLSGLLLGALVLLVVVFAGIRVAERLRPTEPLPAPPLPVEVLRLQPQPFARVRHYTGTIRSGRRARLAAQVNARVVAVLHREGEWVEEGALLLRLDDTELANEVQRLEAGVQRIRAELSFWRQQLERDRELLAKKLVSPKQRDESRRMVRTLEASLAESEHALEAARTRLGYTEIRAPFAGRIQERNIETGELAVPGQPVMELVALRPLKAVITVPQRDMGRLASGQPVRLAMPLREARWEASLTHIYPAVDPATRNAFFEVPVTEAITGLLPGMAVTAAVVVEQIPDALVIPHHALQRRQGGTGVFVAEGGTARWRRVETGDSQAGRVPVRSGLVAGERIIVTPDPRLKDGARIVVVRGGLS